MRKWKKQAPLPWSKQWLKDEAGKAANLLPELSAAGAAGTGYSFGAGGVDQAAFSSAVSSQSEALYDSIGLGQQQPSVYSQSLTASLGTSAGLTPLAPISMDSKSSPGATAPLLDASGQYQQGGSTYSYSPLTPLDVSGAVLSPPVGALTPPVSGEPQPPVTPQKSPGTPSHESLTVLQPISAAPAPAPAQSQLQSQPPPPPPPVSYLGGYQPVQLSFGDSPYSLSPADERPPALSPHTSVLSPPTSVLSPQSSVLSPQTFPTHHQELRPSPSPQTFPDLCGGQLHNDCGMAQYDCRLRSPYGDLGAHSGVHGAHGTPGAPEQPKTLAQLSPALSPDVRLYDERLMSHERAKYEPHPGSVQMPDYSSYPYPQYAGYTGYNYSSSAGGLLSK
ncbi:hypothetical protein FJT64_004088 [Amphibalanus amphitrite]|uniref:Uncharacterized protein n=1 Tax=Amphibalanus amphitrite TaxID=1232801 RepID=A0A6A4W646_AMPAM|nr:hypothetical protein FJT64_004088 [Amphibalanus amphitrite]